MKGEKLKKGPEIDLPVVIFANRKDFFLTKICVASIRFYYPDVDIYLVKDLLNGPFNTKQLSRLFAVKELKLRHKYYGWAAAKIHFLLNKKLARRKYLCMDSDIVFLGKVLNQLAGSSADFLLNPEYTDNIRSQSSKDTYFDVDQIVELYPGYQFPGFFFNTGQTVVTPGIISDKFICKGFDPERYPYYINRSYFPCADQSVLNAALPDLINEGLKVDVVEFMKWSVHFFDRMENMQIEKYLDGNYEFLVHYAGDKRSPEIHTMRGNKILEFHQNYYRKQLTAFGKWWDKRQNYLLSVAWINRIYYVKNKLFIKFVLRQHL